jgi:hypothetical protein
MKIQTEPFGKEYDWRNYASITELSYALSGLRLVVSAPIDKDDYVEIFFPDVQAFQVLRENDYLEYWKHSGFRSNHLIYKMICGGWRDRVGSNYLQITNAYKDDYSEWLIIGTEDCVNVVSASEPLVRNFE